MEQVQFHVQAISGWYTENVSAISGTFPERRIEVGLLAAAFLSRLLNGMLYGVSRADAATYIGVTLGVLLTAGLASPIPARRAARPDPMQTLRHD